MWPELQVKSLGRWGGGLELLHLNPSLTSSRWLQVSLWLPTCVLTQHSAWNNCWERTKGCFFLGPWLLTWKGWCLSSGFGQDPSRQKQGQASGYMVVAGSLTPWKSSVPEMRIFSPFLEMFCQCISVECGTPVSFQPCPMSLCYIHLSPPPHA